MRPNRKTQDYHRINGNVLYGHYYGAGIPSPAWDSSSDELRFKLMSHDEGTHTSKDQSDWFDKLKSGDLFETPLLTIISSYQDDSLSTMQGYEIMKTALRKQKRVQITESSGVKSEEITDETVFMLTNVYDEAPPDRIQLIRDWCYRHETCFRIICAAGDPLVIKRKLKLQVDGLLYLDSRSVSEKSFA